DAIKSIISYTKAVGAAIPTNYLDESVREQFFSDHYSRIILNTTTDTEGEEAFGLVEEVQKIAGVYYGDDYHVIGESASLYDMKQIVEHDNTVVNILTVVLIALVLLVTFRSISIPAAVLLTIQSSVWINLAVPYFTD